MREIDGYVSDSVGDEGARGGTPQIEARLNGRAMKVARCAHALSFL